MSVMLLSLKIGLGLLGLLSASGALYQFASTKYEDYAYPPLGKMIDVGGYRLHMQDAGTGAPTVILDAGCGCNSLDWSLVQPEIAKFARVISYDRAGYGCSDASPHPRTSEVMVNELHTLLRNARVPTPYILVGHSLGGINMRLFASCYPDEVAGIVLVDSSHENQLEVLPEPPSSILENQNLILTFVHFGVLSSSSIFSVHKKAARNISRKFSVPVYGSKISRKAYESYI